MIDWIQVINLAFGVLIGGLGLVLLVRSLPRLLMTNREERWQPVQGTVTRTFIETSAGDSTTYRACVEYRYRYIDRELTGDGIGPLQVWHSSKDAAEKVLVQSGYAHGGPVTVFVNPEKPAESVLEPGNQTLIALYHSVGGALLVTWAYFVIARHLTPE